MKYHRRSLIDSEKPTESSNGGEKKNIFPVPILFYFFIQKSVFFLLYDSVNVKQTVNSQSCNLISTRKRFHFLIFILFFWYFVAGSNKHSDCWDTGGISLENVTKFYSEI